MDDLRFEVINADCLDAMAAMDAGSVHAVVCDPPYGLGFMGRDWDHAVPGVEYWAAALRVAKPGAHLLAFGGTRLWHRLATAIEDAGWEVRDTVLWMYGSGFPKSHDVSKAIDAAAGAERKRQPVQRRANPSNAIHRSGFGSPEWSPQVNDPVTEAARRWDGWGTALKPAWEPVILARKPLGGTVAACVTTHGTGALNIAGCRVDFASTEDERETKAKNQHTGYANPGSNRDSYSGSMPPRQDYTAPGRWPANVVLDADAAALLDREAGPVSTNPAGVFADGQPGGWPGGKRSVFGYGDSGGPSRFFYCGKATREDRDDGMDTDRNAHPTVKPTDLMRYLCRLVTPPGGVVLDPFCGSGSTGRGALLEGFHFVGIERDPEHAAVARKRIAAALGPSLFARAVDMGVVRN